MGFGKWLVGGVCAVGAVIAAPIVLPIAAGAAVAAAGAAATAAATVGAAAAATATAVGGVAAAAGGVVASSAIGTAVTGAAGVIASSAVGTAVAGTMATVGGAVGTVAGTVGLGTVATVAGTTAGATAVGTIATAGTVGAATAASGGKKMFEAKEIIDAAEKRYDSKKLIIDQEEIKTNKRLEDLGKLKLEVWQGFEEFYETISKIKNCSILEGEAKNESFNISKDELDNLRRLSFKANELLGASAGSLGVGALTGLGVYGGTMAIGTASTGTAIAGLSGIASTNATLAALGGGALKVGGLGMAGGSAVLSGLVAAPALAIGGIFLSAKGSNNLKKAHEVTNEVNSAIIKMDESIKLIQAIDDAVGKISFELKALKINFEIKLVDLKKIVSRENNFAYYTEAEVQIVETTILSVKILKRLTTTDILVKKDNEQVLNRINIESVVQEANSLNSHLI